MSKRLGIALVCMGLLSGVLGVFAPSAGADHVTATGERGVTPTYEPGNPKCAPDEEVRHVNGAPTNSTENGVTISNATNTSFDWSSDQPIGTVIVKAGNGAHVYSYSPGVNSDTGLQSPHTQHNDPDAPVAGISHISFCVGELEEGEGNISVEKSPDNGTVDHGNDIEFTIVVTAGGDADSTNVELSDELPEGFDWVIDAQDGTACTDPIVGGTLDCDIGTMQSGGTYSVTVSASTEGADCEQIDNTASVTSDNDSDTDDGDVEIVNCDGPPPTPPGGFTVTQEPELGSLTISKAVVNGAGDESFDFLVECGDSSQILTLSDGTSHTIDDLEEGTECTVTEQAPEDTDTVTWSTTIEDSDGDSDGSVTIDGDESVAFTNTRNVEPEVAGVVVERPPAAAPVTVRPQPAPAPEVVAVAQEATLPRTGLETSDFMLFAGLALVLGGLLLGLGDSFEQRLARGRRMA